MVKSLSAKHRVRDFSKITKEVALTSQLSEYKPGVEILATVPNTPGQTNFTGWVVIADKTTGAQVTEARVTPNWTKPANTADGACRILIQYGKDVLEGRAQGGDFVNNG
jgi:hypothetical protein